MHQSAARRRLRGPILGRSALVSCLRHREDQTNSVQGDRVHQLLLMLLLLLKVFFLDYGNEEDVDRAEIYKLPEGSRSAKMPPQAILVALQDANIKTTLTKAQFTEAVEGRSVLIKLSQ